MAGKAAVFLTDRILAPMTRTSAWLVLLVLGPAALGQPPILPPPRPLPNQKKDAAADTKAGNGSSRPVLFPQVPFPPPAPPVRDPRTGAWQQVRGPAGPHLDGLRFPMSPPSVGKSPVAHPPLVSQPGSNHSTPGLDASYPRQTWLPGRPRTLELSRNEYTGQWDVVEAVTGR
jgi:hypothetical protein